jgi:cyclopropane-fatty-acyl-phospholipid synthase
MAASPRPRTLPVTRADLRLAELVEALEDLRRPCALVLPDGSTIARGGGVPLFTLRLRSERLLERGISQWSLADAYVHGDLDVTMRGAYRYEAMMALLDLRDHLPLGVPIRQMLRFAGDLVTPAVWANARAIDHHYSDDELLETFLDRRHRFYSQGVWKPGTCSSEQAADAKLARMHAALGLRPGMRLLDIGGGWGGLAAHCVRHRIQVTSLTLTHPSARKIRARIGAACSGADLGTVYVEDFLDHHPGERYDRVVIFGVIEHIPNYRRFCERLWAVLKPGGLLFLDASATREKYAASAFTRDYTWRGPHSCLALPDLLQELLYAGMDVCSVQLDSEDYRKTMWAWARRWDAAHETVAERWGEQTHRAFRLFLWGGAHGFARDRLQAYSLVARRGDRPGPRPRLGRRVGHFIASSVSR